MKSPALERSIKALWRYPPGTSASRMARESGESRKGFGSRFESGWMMSWGVEVRMEYGEGWGTNGSAVSGDCVEGGGFTVDEGLARGGRVRVGERSPVG